MDKATGYADAMAEAAAVEALEEMEQRQADLEKLWDALVAFVRSEAEYAAREVMNRNDCSDVLARDRVESAARAAFFEVSAA